MPKGTLFNIWSKRLFFMKKPLLKVKIQNFKSIKELDFEIGNEIKYLVGKNECGKSNILEAITKFNNKKLQAEDKNFNSDEKKLIISHYLQISKSFLKKWFLLLKMKMFLKL